MNSCCNLPVEIIAADQHKNSGECCLVTEKTDAPAQAECPISKTSSRKVQQRTLEHLLKSEKVAEMKNVQYYYCTAPDCKVVYFSNESAPYFTVEDVRVKVFSKDKGDDVNVCYCFDWTRGKIKQEIKHTGKSNASFEIAQKVKEKFCNCDIKNPKGECCLGDVNRLIKLYLSQEKSAV